MTNFFFRHHLSLLIQPFVLALTFLTVRPVFSQEKSFTDSLKEELELITTDTLRTPLLRKLAWHYLAYNPQQSAPYLTELNSIANHTNDKFLLAITDNYFGIKNRLDGKYGPAIDYFQKALEFYRSDDKYKNAATGPLFNLALIYKNLGDYARALKMNFEILGVHENSGNTAMISQTYNAIGNTYKDLVKYPEAIEFFDTAYTVAKMGSHLAEMALSIRNKANVFLEMKQFEQSIPLTLESLEIELEREFNPGLAASYESLANAYSGLEEPTKALKYILDAIEINDSLGLVRELIVNYLVAADIFHRLRDLVKAEHYAAAARTKSRKIKDIESELLAEQQLAVIYELQNEYTLAIQSHKSAASLHDSLFNRDKLELMQNYEILYEVEKKETEIRNLAQQNILSNLAIDRQKKLRSVLVGGIILLLISIILIARILQLRISAQKLKRENEQVIYSKKIAQLEYQQKSIAMNSMLNGQEKERARIAKDLHDGLGSLLSTIKYQFESIIDRATRQKETNSLVHTGELLDTACDEVRRIAHNMMPQALSEFGLVAAVEDLADSVRKTGIEVFVEVLDPYLDRLPLDQENAIYRIIQELLQNCIKHAEAKRIIIQFSCFDETMIVTVEDDGIGFDTSKQKSGMGLQNIRTRIEVLKGDLEIDTTPDIGSTFMIKIPLTKTNH